MASPTVPNRIPATETPSAHLHRREGSRPSGKKSGSTAAMPTWPGSQVQEANHAAAVDRFRELGTLAILSPMESAGGTISGVVTEAVKALNAEEITELCLRHTLYDWAAQAGLKPLPVVGAQGVYFHTADGRRF